MGYTLSSAPGKVSVVVARQQNLRFLLFFPLWAAGLATLVLNGPRGVLSQPIFATIFFGLMTGIAAYAWLWNLVGKEELEFTASALMWKRTLLGISRNRIFPMNRIDNPHFENSRRSGKARIPSGIAFSCEGKQLRVGDHLTQRDAREIVAAILLQLPELGQLWGRYKEGLPELDESMSLNLK